MIIVKDERVENKIQKCEQCGEIAQGRSIEAIDRIHGEGRGWWFLCFECFGPQIHWKKSEGGMLYKSPAPQAPLAGE